MCGATLVKSMCCPVVLESASRSPQSTGRGVLVTAHPASAGRSAARGGSCGAQDAEHGERREEGSRLYAAGHYTVLAIMIPGSLHRGALILLGAAAGNNKQPPPPRIIWLLVTLASKRR